MTITSTTSKVTANGNGIATVFSFSPITIFTTDQLQVTFVSTLGLETVLTEGVGSTNYSVSILQPLFLPSTGSITYPASGGSPLASGEKLIIKRLVELKQETNLKNQGGYFPDVQEAAFDYDMMVDIQQQEQIDRSLKLPVSSTASADLPAPEANKALVWNSGATALQNLALNITIDTSTLVVVSGVAPGLVDGRIWIDTSIGGQRVVKICDGSDFNEIVRFNTATGALTYTVAGTFTAATTIALAAAGTPLTKSVTDAGATGVVEVNDHNSSSPAANDIIFSEQFKGRDSATNTDTYAEDQVVISDPTSTSEGAIRKFRTVVAGTLADRLLIGAGIYTPAQTDKGANTVNASGLYIAGTLVGASDVSIQSGTTHSPALSDHGKSFIYTNASGCTITMPAASGLFAGWKISVFNASASQVIVNRSSTDVMISKGTSFTALRLPTNGDSGSFTLDSTGGSAKFYWFGKRSFVSADITPAASTTNTQAHNLGLATATTDIYIRNSTGELGYTAGDIIRCGNGADRGGAQRNYQLTLDATNGVFQIGTAATVGVLNKTTPATWVSITTLANWRHFWTAEVIN